MATTDPDLAEIDRLTAAFFALFDNRAGPPALERIFALCLPEARIVKAVASTPEVMDLAAFIAPRRALLTDGRLTAFHERELSAQTTVFGNIALRGCTYRKAGVLEGVPFEADGVKSFQFLRTSAGWRIVGVTWDDARDGLALDALRQHGALPGA